MTANSLSSMPVEMINRMDERWFFREPAEDERVAILKIHLRQARQDPNNFDLAVLAQSSKDLVGREIEQAIAAAMVESFDQGKTCLDQTILAQQLSSKPRITNTMRDEIEEITNWVGYNEDQDEGIRARLASAKGSSIMHVVND
jgi:SpoVK/Ycf46/Vps4 family AAA+-type ATPase